MSPKTITIIGSLNTDLVTTTPRVPSGGETLTASSFSTGSGGKGANQAVACARLSRPNPNSSEKFTPDVEVKMIGAVGSDEFGAPLIDGLKASFIDTALVKTVPGSTGVAVILVESTTGENRILLSPGANHSLQPSSFITASSFGTPQPSLLILQLEIPLETVLQILATASASQIPILFNPAPAVPLPETAYPCITHLIVNETEAALLTSRSLSSVSVPDFQWSSITDEFLQKGVKNIVITLGSKGAFWANGKGNGMVQAEKVRKVVDTTAAGDTFVGAYAVEVVKGGEMDLEAVVRRACRAAGRTVEKSGAQSAIPWADEVDI